MVALTATAACLLADDVLAVSDERKAALLAGEGDVSFFLTWFVAVGVASLAGSLLCAWLGRRIWRGQVARAGLPGLEPNAAQQAGLELSVLGCLAVSAAIVLGALALAVAIAATTAVVGKDLQATSSESGVLEWLQLILWLGSAAVAIVGAASTKDRESRSLLVLLAAGALLIAAREIDLHEKLNSDVLGYWGVHYRRDWWVSSKTPVLPRIVWALVGLGLLVGGALVAWRGAIAMFLRGGRHGRLIWVLTAAAGLMVAGYALDDLLRYSKGINLRQSQVCEETLEATASLVYLATVFWAIRLSKMARRV